MKSFLRSHKLSLGAVCIATCFGYAMYIMDAHAQTAGGESRPAEVDTSNATPVYANFARVTGTPEELVVDFGLNTTVGSRPDKPLKVDHRVVMNFFTAKRFATALQASIARHEAAFGPIETDVSKRLKAAQ
jgi:uncharacterized protein DUF3467